MQQSAGCNQDYGMQKAFYTAPSFAFASQLLLQLAQLQLHMLSQNTAATSPVLSSCTALLVQMAQGPHQQPLFCQLQLHFCILRVLVLLNEGRYGDLQKTGSFTVPVSNIKLSQKCNLIFTVGT